MIGVGIAGTGFIARVHAQALKQVKGARVVGIYGRTPENVKKLQKELAIPSGYRDFDEFLRDKSIDAVIIALPNYQHAEFTLKALEAGKHVLVEKPLAVNLEDGIRMIDLARKKGLVLGYAEELVYIPKFKEAMKLVEGIGRVYHIRQVEKHDGPYSRWFFEPESAGGGAVMDMGCHSIELIRWVAGKKKVQWVQAVMGTYLHQDKTRMEDHMVVMMGFEDGSIGQAEASWALKGGMDSILEIYGTEGVVYADLLKGMGIRAYSEKGFKDMWEPNKGWVYPAYDWLYNNGYPQEDQDFVDAIKQGRQMVETGEDGLVVLELIYAAYHSAATGNRVYLPFRPAEIRYAVDLYLNKREYLVQGPVDEIKGGHDE